MYFPIQANKHRDNKITAMKIMTDKKLSTNQTTGSQRPMVVGLLIASILGLCACSMPSPTSGGSSSSGGLPSSGGGSTGPSNTGGGVPNPGGGAPNPGGDAGGSTPPPSGGGGSADGSNDGGDSSGGESGDSIEGLDEALDESLEDFDETVLGEGNRNGSDSIDILSPSGTSGGIDSDEPLFEEAGSGAAQGNASIEQRAAEGAPPGTESTEAQTGQASSGPEQVDSEIIPIPDDIDDGQGDDIVLRQIRDAAIKERDPILREKLWDEYRRIKGQG